MTDCGCRPPRYTCPQHSGLPGGRADQPIHRDSPEGRRIAAAQPQHGPGSAMSMSRAERRRRGYRGPLLPREVTRMVGTEQGISPQQVTTAYLAEERRA